MATGTQIQVQVHQGDSSSSAGSSASDYTNSPPSTNAGSTGLTPGKYRQYGSDNHTVDVSITGNNVLVQHNMRQTQHDAPTPSSYR